jgi:hypothetical protein
VRTEIKESFSKGFYLSEESIKKIEDIISKRIGKHPGYKQTFSCRRVDHAGISYDSSAELIGREENSRIDSVNYLKIEGISDEASARLIFEKGEKTILEIKSEERDNGLLLSADLKEYLRSEVFRGKLASIHRFIAKEQSLVLNLTLMAALFFSLMVLVFMRPDGIAAIDVGRSSIDQKINFLVERNLENRKLDKFGIYAPSVVFLPLMIFLFSLKTRAFSPVDTFYWGKEMSKYDSAKSLRDKIWWGVIVALVVGVIATILTENIPRLA